MGRAIGREVRWNRTALHNFLEILNYIKKDSPENARKVKLRIQKIINDLPNNPLIFREDELKRNNDGSNRVFNKDGIRVSYKIDVKEIFITRLVHSSQEPDFF